MTASTEAPLWHAVDRLLAHAEVEGILAHRLGPLAAYRLRQHGMPVPDALLQEERLARMTMMTSIPLLKRIRDLSDGPIVLVKGPEVACMYPGRARSFSDLDVLVVNGAALHSSLKAAGLVEVDDPDLFEDYRHLRPLQAPRMWLKVEIHTQPIVPDGVAAPPLEEIVEASVPSALGIDGISAPDPVHHALMLAGHAWDDHSPLGILRDLIDVEAVARLTLSSELTRTALRWGIGGIWRTTHGATTALFADGQPTAALRLFGQHLPSVRERTVLENHTERWLSPFWAMPFHRALLETPHALRKGLFPDPDESWNAKLHRVKHALLHPGRSMSTHTENWRRDSARAGDRRP